MGRTKWHHPSVEVKESRQSAVFKLPAMRTRGLMFHPLKLTLKAGVMARLAEVLTGRFLSLLASQLGQSSQVPTIPQKTLWTMFLMSHELDLWPPHMCTDTKKIQFTAL